MPEFVCGTFSSMFTFDFELIACCPISPHRPENTIALAIAITEQSIKKDPIMLAKAMKTFVLVDSESATLLEFEFESLEVVEGESFVGVGIVCIEVVDNIIVVGIVGEDDEIELGSVAGVVGIKGVKLATGEGGSPIPGSSGSARSDSEFNAACASTPVPNILTLDSVVNLDIRNPSVDSSINTRRANQCLYDESILLQ